MRKSLAKTLFSLLLLFCVAEAFAEVPIVFSRCKATGDWTDTRTVTLNDSSTPEITKTFKASILDRFNEVNYPLSRIWGVWNIFLTPCDLIYRDAGGNETVIEDCSSSYNAGGGANNTATCSALDPVVSFDGTEIMYTVFRGDVLRNLIRINDGIYHPDAVETNGPWQDSPASSLNADGAHIKKYVVGGAASDVTTFTSGVWEISPVYLPNGRISFVSTETGSSLTATTNIVLHTTASEPVMSIWTADADGRNKELASAHARSQEHHPIILRDGRLAYSSWQIGMGIPFSKTQGAPGGSSTIINLFKLWAQYPDGSRNFPIMGQHAPQAQLTSFDEQLGALHFIAQLPDERVCAANYYRGNNGGAGLITCCPLPAFDQEGQDPHTVANEADQYLPSGCTGITTAWGHNNDDVSNLMPGYPNTPVTHPNYTSALPYAGKPSYPFAIRPVDGEIGIAWAKGACSVAGNDDAVFTAIGATPPNLSVNNNGKSVALNHSTSLGEALQAYGNGYTSDIPSCNYGIYKATSLPINSPADLVMIVDTKDHHEFGARAVVPYSEIYGVAAPVDLAPIKKLDAQKGTPFGWVGAASVTDRETTPRGGVPTLETVNIHAFNLQGTETVESLGEDDFCGVRFLQMEHNTSLNAYNDIAGATGEPVAVLGDLYTVNKDGSGNPIMETDGIHKDTSFLVSIPANVPYTMAGIDCQGRNLNIDQTWQHVKPGEQKTCDGCHIHSHPPRNQFAQSHAATAGYVSRELGKGTVPLLSGLDGNGDPVFRNMPGYGVVINYEEHIKPILLNRCASCHSASGTSTGGDREKGLVLDSNPNPATYHTDPSSTYYRLVYDRNQTGLDDTEGASQPWQQYKHTHSSTNLSRPYLSKYIVAFNSRRSLFYWKTIGQRVDNNTDAEYTGDLDYGDAHPATTITSDEAATIALWIDTGAQHRPQIAADTMPPTVHMNVTLDTNNHITDLIIGTVDLGSGIDPATLNVCLVTGGTCGSNLAGPASMHGITSINLATPISDPNQLIRASVSDVSGNTRTIEYTAGYLISLGDTGSPPPPDPVSISIGGNETINEGDTFSRTITFTDGEDTNNDGWTYDIDWCGTPENGNTILPGSSSFSISRQFPAAGSCPTTVTITDAAGESDIGTLTITIDASASSGDVSISAGGKAVVREGSSFTRTISISDPSDSGGDGHTYVLRFDGVQVDSGTIPAGATSFIITQTMPDGDKRVQAEVEVTDVAGDVDTETFEIVVQNVPPKATIIGAETATVGTEYNITLAISDPGDDQIYSTQVDWGDENNTDILTHTFIEPGTFTIRIWVGDEDGLWLAGQKRVTVQ